MTKLIFLVSLITIFNLNMVAHGQTRKCEKGWEKKQDEDVAKLITVGSSRKFPENRGADVKRFCDEATRLLGVLDYRRNNCMDNLNKQLQGVLVYSAKAGFGRFCKPESKNFEKLLRSGRCANSGSTQVRKCYTELIDKFLGIKNGKDDKKKLPWLCCSTYEMFACLSNKLQGVERCSPETIEDLLTLVRGITGSTMDVFCGDYTESSDKCDKLEAPPKKLKSQRRTKSFVSPMVAVLEGFPEV